MSATRPDSYRQEMEETTRAIVVRRTPVPLMRQLRDDGRSDDELTTVSAALALARELFGSRIDFDGGPALNHFIGAASVAATIGLPTPYVAFALVHNAYRAGAFADGRSFGADDTRRALVRRAVGPEIEALVHDRFANATDMFDGPIPDPETREGFIQLTDLCELYEKFEDGRIHAAYPGRADVAVVRTRADDLVERARHLGGGAFADALDEALHRPPDIPVGASSGTTYGFLQIPSQTIIRPTVSTRRAWERIARRAQEGTWWARRQRRRAGRLARRVLG